MIVLTAVTLLATFDAVFASSCLMYNINESPTTLRYMRYEPLTAPVTHGCILACQALENCTAVAVWNQTSGEGRNCSLLIVESGESVEYGDGSGVGADPNAELMTKPGGPVAPPPPCPTGFTLLEGSCFIFTDLTQSDWGTSKTYCETGITGIQARMATVDSLQKAMAVNTLVPVNGFFNGWIGAKKDGTTNHKHLYTGVDIPPGDPLWDTHQPAAADCVYLDRSTGKLYAYLCTITSFGVFCEVDKTSS